MKQRLTIFGFLGLAVVVSPIRVAAQSMEWSAGYGQWEVAENWSPAHVPALTNAISIDNGGTCTVSQAGAEAFTVYVGSDDNKTGTLHIASGDLTVSEQLNVGYSGGIGHLIQDGGLLTGPTNGNYIVIGNEGGQGTFDFSNGNLNAQGQIFFGWFGECEINLSGTATLTNSGYYAIWVALVGNSVVTMRDQSKIDARDFYLNSSGQGQVTIADEASIHTRGTTQIGKGSPGLGELILTNNGSFHVHTHCSVGYGGGSTGVVNIVGGEFIQRLNWIKTLKLGDGGCGTINMGNAEVGGVLTNDSNTYYGDLTVNTTAESKGTLQGWGSVSFYRNLDNSGRIIANGYGSERTLDLSTFGTGYAAESYPNEGVVNSFDNTANNGWFAVNKGRLLLPDVAVSADAGAVAYNWGECADDTTPDLVNSARLTLVNASDGTITGALLAADRTDVPEGLHEPYSVWSFSAGTFDSATLTVRYDDGEAAARQVAEADLKLWRHDGSRWTEVTAVRDTEAKTLTSTSMDGLGVFAVSTRGISAGTLFVIR